MAFVSKKNPQISAQIQMKSLTMEDGTDYLVFVVIYNTIHIQKLAPIRYIGGILGHRVGLLSSRAFLYKCSVQFGFTSLDQFPQCDSVKSGYIPRHQCPV